MVEFAFGADGAAVGERDVFGDGQSEAGAAGFTGTGFVDAVEAFEQARQVFGGDAGSEILNVEFDSEFDSAPGGAGAEGDASAGTSVFHGIVNQVGKNLMNGLAIGEDQRQGFGRDIAILRMLDLQFDSVTAGDLAETLFGVMQQFQRGNGFYVEAGFAGFDARQG